MDYLQYPVVDKDGKNGSFSFKPYYKWITFNISTVIYHQLILIIRFKPYYKWITFNIKKQYKNNNNKLVLNLIINGLPSILFAPK